MQTLQVNIQNSERRLVLADTTPPQRQPGEILVAVQVISLNHGEVHTALHAAPDGSRPGWEYAGIVLEADQTSRFAAGDRVFGLMLAGAWAEEVSAPEALAAHVPEGVALETAVTLPVAGLTAALALSKQALVRDSRVLITAANGAVGRLAIQLAAARSAHVTAYIRRPEQEPLMRSLGAHDVLFPQYDFGTRQPFNLVLEGVGGALLGRAMTHLASEGVCVLFGNVAHGEQTTFDPDAFRLRDGSAYGGTTLYGFFLGNEIMRTPAPPLLDTLAQSLRDGTLEPSVAKIDAWSNADAVARALLANAIDGRAVLRVIDGSAQ